MFGGMRAAYLIRIRGKETYATESLQIEEHHELSKSRSDGIDCDSVIACAFRGVATMTAQLLEHHGFRPAEGALLLHSGHRQAITPMR
jgi:hypothetical protein